jgi:hypothetical protein
MVDFGQNLKTWKDHRECAPKIMREMVGAEDS